jgi:predicted ATPase/DNA-binding CsgD family transcriptional regulator
LIELASLTDARLVPRVIASTLGQRDETAMSPDVPGGSTTSGLVAMLRFRQALLILDNCEHLTTAVAVVVDHLLRSCPDLRVLATSREPLGVVGESAWRLSPLSLPHRVEDDQAQLTASASVPLRGERGDDRLGRQHVGDPCVRALRSEAVRLFADRAAAACPTFTIDAENVALTEEVCRRLDGIPLAIELATARLRGLTLNQIASRLDDRFTLLTSGSPAALPRHQTLRSLVDWSYELLSPAEQALLQCLSVFAGGFTAEAADAVAGTEYGVLDLLARLVEKSLVVLDGSRYRLLETIRQYAAEKLRASGDEQAARRRHRDWCVDFAEQAELRLRTAEHEAWMARVESEHDNLRAAIAWSRATPDDPAGPRLIAALFWFWDIRGHWGEARGHGEWALSVCAGTAVRERGKLLNGMAMLAYELSEYDRAAELASEALARCRDSGDTWGVCYALEMLGLVAYFRGDFAQATLQLDEARALADETGDIVNGAFALLYLGVVAYARGEAALARQRYEASLKLWRVLRCQAKLALGLMLLGRIAYVQGRREEALDVLEESLAVAREAGSPRAIAWSLLYLGFIARAEGDLARARSRYVECLEQRWSAGDQRGIAQCFEGLAAVEVAHLRQAGPGSAERAARLYGVAEGLRDRIRAPIPPSELADYERDVRDLRDALGEPSLSQCWEAGRLLSLEAAVTFARGLPSSTTVRRSTTIVTERPSGRRLGHSATEAGPSAISPREREIALLIARGLTSREIAAELSIAKRTVDTHAWNIIGKLGLESRAHLAAWVGEHWQPIASEAVRLRVGSRR